MLVDNLLPAAVAASRSSQQWEKEPGRRVKGGQGARWAAAHTPTGGRFRLEFFLSSYWNKKRKKKKMHVLFCLLTDFFLKNRSSEIIIQTEFTNSLR